MRIARAFFAVFLLFAASAPLVSVAFAVPNPPWDILMDECPQCPANCNTICVYRGSQYGQIDCYGDSPFPGPCYTVWP